MSFLSGQQASLLSSKVVLELPSGNDQRTDLIELKGPFCFSAEPDYGPHHCTEEAMLVDAIALMP